MLDVEGPNRTELAMAWCSYAGLNWRWHGASYAGLVIIST